MISASAAVKEIQQSELAPQFTVGPPLLNPLAASSQFSITKRADGLALDALGEFRDEESGSDDDISERMIAGARRRVTLRPNSAQAHATLGVALLNSGRLESAEAEFELALSIQPTHYVAATNLARIKVRAGRFDEAELIYKSLQHHYPKNATPALSLAFIAMKQQDYVSAERLLAEAIRLGRRAVTAKYHLAMVLLRQGKSREAIALLRSTARDEVRAPAVYEGLGAAYALNGDFHRAAVAFKTALSLAPGSSNAVRGLARILLELKQTDEAVELLVEYLEKTPHDNAARELLARGYEARKQRRSAIAQLAIVFAAIDTSNNDDVSSKARISNNIGASFLNDGDLMQAQRWLTRSVEYTPMDNPIPYQNLTRCYLMIREFTKAVETARLTRARFPNDPIGVELLSISLRELGLYDDAIREVRLFIDSGRIATAGIYADLGYMLSDAKRDYDSALVFLQQGYDKFKHDSLVANNLAYAYLMQGNVQAARTIMESIRPSQDELSKNPEILVCVTATRGLLHLVEGDIEKGSLFYRKAEKLALEQHKTELARAVLQKMHLELARVYFRQHDYGSARAHIRQGFAVRKGREVYAEDLRALEQNLSILPE